jgi:hypothetical protein
VTFTELKRRVMTALDHPNTGNRLVATIALNDYDDARQERIDTLEAVLHTLATSPRTPQWVVDEARSVLGQEDPADRGDAWTGGFAANH